MEQNLAYFCQFTSELLNQKIPFVIVSLVGIRGSAPQNIGARMIVGKQEILFGSVGGGMLENRCLDVARGFLNMQGQVPPSSYTWNLQRDIGMSCGGEVTILFELQSLESSWEIAIFGAGHISQHLVPILQTLNCSLTVIDSRREWLDKIPLKLNTKMIHAPTMEDVVVKLSENTYVAIMTMGHRSDLPILRNALEKRDFPYLGTIGSQAKRNRLEKELLDTGTLPEKVKTFFCPMGEKIGNNSPAEIAISITSQLIRVRDQYVLSKNTY